MTTLGLALTLIGIAALWAAVLQRHLPQNLLRRRVDRAATTRIRQIARLAAPTAALAAVGGGVTWWLGQLPIVSLVAALGCGYVPVGVARARAASRAREREQGWPAAMTQLADGLEAGLAFPAAAEFVATSGPIVLRADFAVFYQAIRDGRLEHGLDLLAAAPERASGAVATLLRAAFVDTSSGRAAPMLRELAAVLRERFEMRERSRVRALSLQREAAILAVSPLAFLLLIGATAPGYLNAYRTLPGTIVSVTGGMVIGGCYLAMRRLGRVPDGTLQ